MLTQQDNPTCNISICLLIYTNNVNPPTPTRLLTFSFPLFFKEYLNPQIRINKTVNEHGVNYHLSPSGLTSGIDPVLFL